MSRILAASDCAQMVAEPRTVERRRWVRLPIRVPMFVRWTDDRQRPFQEFATVLSISAGGALLAMQGRLPAGAKVSLEIPSTPTLDEIAEAAVVHQFEAEVIRVERRGKAHFVATRFSIPIGKA